MRTKHCSSAYFCPKESWSDRALGCECRRQYTVPLPLGSYIKPHLKKTLRGERPYFPRGIFCALLADSRRTVTLRVRAYAQWRGIEDACSNRRWLTWSRDLRKLAALGEEKQMRKSPTKSTLRTTNKWPLFVGKKSVTVWMRYAK